MAAGTFYTYVQSTYDPVSPFKAVPSNGGITFVIYECEDKVVIVAYFYRKDDRLKMVYTSVDPFIGNVGIGFSCAVMEMLCFKYDFSNWKNTEVSIENFLYRNGFKLVPLSDLV